VDSLVGKQKNSRICSRHNTRQYIALLISFFFCRACIFFTEPAFNFGAALYTPVLYHFKINCTVHSGMATAPSWKHIYRKSSAETGCDADVPLLRAWHRQPGVTCPLDHQFSLRMASTVLQAQKVNFW